MAREYPSLPDRHTDAFIAQVARTINVLLKGRGNSIGTFDLAASPATTTTVSDNRFEQYMTVNLMPMNATAATCDWRITTRSDGSFVVTHLPALATATFTYSFRG